MKFLNFIKDGDEAQAIPVSNILFVEEQADAVNVYIGPIGTDIAKKVAISVSTGTARSVAAKLLDAMAGSHVKVITVDSTFDSNITGIADIA